MSRRTHLALVALFLLPLAAAGQQATGPDVIVGSLTGPSNHASLGGFEAYSIGTTSCNIGDTPLRWEANNPNHPVIAQHAYRLKNGRFEQVGQSWLKHGFTALQGTVCGSCTPHPNGTALGVGCSDPYGSGLNGQQSGLGPKFEVDAHTGVFPFPYTGRGATGNSIYKRLQIAIADVDPALNAGALYFVEGHYVTRDDAAAGNQNNNASWREVVFGSSGSASFPMSFAPGSTTHRTEPAIMAWQAHDPAVALRAVDVPNEGRFWTGFKVTDNGNGTYSWEFAVHNLNSHRSAGSFSVDVPAGATVSNIGFHDVDYHSGEPFDGTDWTGSVSNSRVTWSTDSFATNADANALRWGTLYNFRFDTDLPPSEVVTGEIGLFRPGTPSSVGFGFNPPGAALSIVSGDDQGVNAGASFAPLVVRVEDAMGNAIDGGIVDFRVVSGEVTLAQPSPVAADVNGHASMTVVAGPNGGRGSVEASTETSTVSFDLVTRRFVANFIPTLATLLLGLEVEAANMPFTLSVDTPQPPVSTPFGDICTSILNPGPDFVAVSGVPAAPFAYDPGMSTNSSGSWSMIIPGLGGLIGAGQRTFQIIGAYFPPQGGFTVIISNCEMVSF